MNCRFFPTLDVSNPALPDFLTEDALALAHAERLRNYAFANGPK